MILGLVSFVGGVAVTRFMATSAEDAEPRPAVRADERDEPGAVR